MKISEPRLAQESKYVKEKKPKDEVTERGLVQFGLALWWRHGAGLSAQPHRRAAVLDGLGGWGGKGGDIVPVVGSCW